MTIEAILVFVAILFILTVGLLAFSLIELKKVSLLDSRIDFTENRLQEVLTRIDILDKSLGDMDIKSAKGIESNKTKLAEFKKEQNNRCDKISRRVEILEDAAGNIESVGNLTEEVKSFGRKLKELDALVDHSTESIAAVSKLAMRLDHLVESHSVDLKQMQMELDSRKMYTA